MNIVKYATLGAIQQLTHIVQQHFVKTIGNKFSDEKTATMLLTEVHKTGGDVSGIVITVVDGHITLYHFTYEK
jgi:hypothetical protein